MEGHISGEEAADKNETKEEKFKRLADRRVNNALDKIRLIGNLASSQYAFTSDQVDKIVQSLKATIADVEDKFHKQLDKKKTKFEL